LEFGTAVEKIDASKEIANIAFGRSGRSGTRSIIHLLPPALMRMIQMIFQWNLHCLIKLHNYDSYST